MADEVAQQEDAEIEAMLAMLETGDNPDGQRNHPRNRNPNLHTDTNMEGEDDHKMDTPYGSDDEEYDSLLIDAVQAVEGQHQHPIHSIPFRGQDHGGGGGGGDDVDMDVMDES